MPAGRHSAPQRRTRPGRRPRGRRLSGSSVNGRGLLARIRRGLMGIPARPRVAPMPTATYRVQMNHHFPFRALAREADYYRDLGVSDLYLSPNFAARPGSLHGYDIVNYGILNPELGSRREFTALSDDLQQMGLGVILDIVPKIGRAHV